MKEYLGSQEHWEDSINQDYDERERRSKEQTDDRIQPDYRFHLHTDLDILDNKYPMVLLSGAEIFAMQEDRVVFVGKIAECKSFIERNGDKFCKQLPLIKK